MVEAHLGILLVGHRGGHPVGQPPLVGRAPQHAYGPVEHRIGVKALHLRAEGLIGGIAVERHEAVLHRHHPLAAQADHRRPDVVQVLARLREQRTVHHRIAHDVRMAADHHVEELCLREQLPVAVVAHVREQHQHVDLGAQRFGGAHRLLLRIGKSDPDKRGFVASRMPRALVVGDRPHEADLHAASLDDRRGRQVREGAGVAHGVGADDLEVHAVDHPAQVGLAVVELMVAECRRIVAQAVHQRNDRSTRHGALVHVGIARPAVAGIDQQGVGQRVAARRNGGGQLRKALDLGVHVVRGEQDERPLAGGAGGRAGDNGKQRQGEPSFHHGFSN